MLELTITSAWAVKQILPGKTVDCLTDITTD